MQVLIFQRKKSPLVNANGLDDLNNETQTRRLIANSFSLLVVNLQLGTNQITVRHFQEITAGGTSNVGTFHV
jgi:hypothetical protein